MISFLAAFMIACFFFSSSATRFSVGGVLVAVSLLVLWCIRTYWVNEFNVATLWLPSGAALWNKCRAIFSYGGEPATEPREPVETLDSLTFHGDAPAGDERQNGTRQQSWPMRIFVRPSISGLPDRVDSDQRETTEV